MGYFKAINLHYACFLSVSLVTLGKLNQAYIHFCQRSLC